MCSKQSIERAKEKLIKAGLCAMDGSGDPDIEALFQRLAIVTSHLQCIQQDMENPVAIKGRVLMALQFVR